MGRFVEHLDTFLRCLRQGQHFALTRYGDGEACIIQNRAVSTGQSNRHWCWRPTLGIGDRILPEELRRALTYEASNYYVGISCPCCGPADYRYYVTSLSDSRLASCVTYANIFSNGNWKHLNARLIPALRAKKRKIVLVTNWDKEFDNARATIAPGDLDVVAASNKYYDRAISWGHVGVKYVGGAVRWYCCERDTIKHQFCGVARAYEDAIFLVQLGPIANVLIHHMFMANPNNTYADMGHSLDPILFGDPSREFHMYPSDEMCQDMNANWRPT